MALRTRKNLSVSLPAPMVELLDRASRLQHRTRSELIREAVHEYFSRRIPVAEATPEEEHEMQRGLEEHARGEYVTLEKLLHDLEDRTQPASREGV